MKQTRVLGAAFGPGSLLERQISIGGLVEAAAMVAVAGIIADMAYTNGLHYYHSSRSSWGIDPAGDPYTKTALNSIPM